MIFYKVWRLIFLSSTISISAFGQEKGMQFDKNSSFKEILNRAAKENKFVFIDCYTTWCGPCKFMDKEIFPEETVGNFYNDHFINVRYQIDTTKTDPQEIKNRYPDASFVRTKYHIRAYPTYLFLNPNGELVHTALGSTGDEQFIEIGKNALNPNFQYYTQLKKYEAGNRDPQFLKTLALLSLHAMDADVTSAITKSYLQSVGQLKDPDDYTFINEVTNNMSDTGFIIMLNHPHEFESVIDKNSFHEHLVMMIVYGEIKSNNSFLMWNKQKWDEYSKLLNTKYPQFSDELLYLIQSNVFMMNSNWDELIRTVDAYRLNHTIPNQQLNNFAWSIFLRSSDNKQLAKALEWSKSSFTGQDKIEPGFMDTYANILYKMGDVKQALVWEKKAQQIAIAQGGSKDWGQDVIDKMNKKEKTW
jgi:thioredoxin-related protein